MKPLPSSLAEWLSYIETVHNKEIDLGLERVNGVYRSLNLLPLGKKVITIAGTNGKGTAVHALEKILLAKGQQVGSYTSPHLIHYNERIRLNGLMVSDETLCDAFAKVEQARANTPLTYFEFGTLAAFTVFAQTNLDVVILEVGLGGRLDAVNCIAADIAVITNIALDHMEYLGNTLETIAREKAGILRKAQIVVLGERDIPQPVLDRAANLNCHVYQWQRQFSLQPCANDIWLWRGSATQGGVELQLKLDQHYLAVESIAVAYQVALCLDVIDDLPSNLFEHMSFQGRCQTQFFDGVEVLLDVAHNPAAAERLRSYLLAHPARGKTVAVFGLMRDKDLSGVIAGFVPIVTQWLLAELGVQRAMSVAQIAEFLQLAGSQHIHSHVSVADALVAARALCQMGDRIVVFGSFTVVGPALESLAVLRERIGLE